MDVSAGYKQTEVGVIPEDWEVVNLGRTCTQVTTGKLDANAMKEDGEYRFYTCAKDYCQIDTYAFDTEALLVSGNGANVGYIHYYKGKFNAYQRTYVLSGFLESIKYLQHYMGQKLADRLRVEVNAGNTPYITRGTLTEMKVALPSTRTEQESIAQALSDADALIESLEQLLAKKRQIKQGAMQELLTGKKRLPGFHGKWEERPLGSEIEDLEAGVSVNSVEDALDKSPGGLAVLKTSSVAGGVFISSECKTIAPRDLGRVKLSPKAESVIVSRMNTIDLVGECGYVPIDFPQLFIPDRLWMTRFKLGSRVSAKWLAFVLSTTSARRLLRNIATGTSGSMKNISKGAFLALEFKFPKPDEQAAIAAILSDLDAEIAELETKLTKARQIKQGMMQELLTGRIRLV